MEVDALYRSWYTFANYDYNKYLNNTGKQVWKVVQAYINKMMVASLPKENEYIYCNFLKQLYIN